METADGFNRSKQIDKGTAVTKHQSKYLAVRRLIWSALLLWATNTNAADPGPMIYGFGALSCGKWLAAAQNSVDRGLNTAWVLGWVSAAGSYGHLPDTDAEAITAWIDNYCRDHPLDKIADASAALVQELAKPKHR